MNIAVDLALDLAPFEQIRRAVTAAVHRGELRPGDRLPTVRQLGRDLGVSPATVGHAYRGLERNGIIHTAGRRGTFVAEPTVSTTASIAQVAQDFVRRSRDLGADQTAILHAVIDALAE